MDRKRYPTACCKCGHEFQIGASIAMQLGMNSGHATCPKCKTFLHVELTEDETAAVTEEWESWLDRTEPETAEMGD